MAIQEQISKLEADSASYSNKTTVVGQPDVPGLSTREMQESVEYMPRNLLLPKLNEVVGAVNQCYTKAEADKAIAGKVTEIGAGDMAKAVYDPNGEGLNFTDLRMAMRQAATLQTDVGNLQTGVDNLQYPNAGAHNAVYRGKALGSSVSEEQYAAIRAGTFDDLYIGDYWTIGGVNYRIAAFDYYTEVDPDNHYAVLVPDTCLYNAQMNPTDTTDGGYFGSAMHKTNLEQAKIMIRAAFGSHIMKHDTVLVNSVSNGVAYAVAFCDSEVDLMCEQMVYGGSLFSAAAKNGAVAANYLMEKSQLPLFQHAPSRICNLENYWLRDVVSNGYFSYVIARNSGYANASLSLGVRPFFCIR